MFTLHIPDMICGGCFAGIERVVKKLDAQATLNADLVAHSVTVVSARESAEIVKAIEAAGFHPVLAA
jgi:copper chaperone CopZ